jgi:hypothetical protein
MTIERHPPEDATPDLHWDDRYAEYLIAVEQLCASAELARLRVEVITVEGGRITGLVGPLHGADAWDRVDAAGSPRTLQIDDTCVCFEEIRQLTIHPPLAGLSVVEAR